MGSIRGTYLKDGNITEIYLPNGITEIQCDNYTPIELDIPEFANAKKITRSKKEHTIRSQIKEAVLMISVFLPYFFFTWKAVDLISDNLPVALGLLGAQIWLMVFLLVNFREEEPEK